MMNVKSMIRNDPKLDRRQHTVSVDSIPSITMTHPEFGEFLQWDLLQPVQLLYKSTRKWRPGVIVGITEHPTGHYLEIHYWKSPRSARLTSECIDAASDCIRPIPLSFEQRAEWRRGSEVECFSESRGRWYLATVVRVSREADDTEDWLELQWLIEHYSTNQREVFSKELQRSSDLIRHRYPHLRALESINFESTGTMLRCDSDIGVVNEDQKSEDQLDQESNSDLDLNDRPFVSLWLDYPQRDKQPEI